jgi:hypothetical protein
MNRMYELEERLNNTGRSGVQYLSDAELKELYWLYDSCIEYFNLTNNQAIEQWFLYKSIGVRNVLNARNLYVD